MSRAGFVLRVVFVVLVGLFAAGIVTAPVWVNLVSMFR